MSTPRPCAATPCSRAVARLRVVWTLAVLLLLVAPFAGFVLPASVLAHHTTIKMPFAAGATWRVLQGYNGSSHQNNSSTWQYYYSLDLVRADGNTAGQRVLSAVDGTIRWIDEAYGGMSINLGDGYAFAYFHTVLAPGLAAGQTIRQGQYLGTVAPPGGALNPRRASVGSQTLANIQERLADLDRKGIDIQFLFPSFLLEVNTWEDGGLGNGVCRGYNTWLAKMCAEAPERLVIRQRPEEESIGDEGDVHVVLEDHAWT